MRSKWERKEWHWISNTSRERRKAGHKYWYWYRRQYRDLFYFIRTMVEKFDSQPYASNFGEKFGWIYYIWKLETFISTSQCMNIVQTFSYHIERSKNYYFVVVFLYNAKLSTAFDRGIYPSRIVRGQYTWIGGHQIFILRVQKRKTLLNGRFYSHRFSTGYLCHRANGRKEGGGGLSNWWYRKR